MSTRKITKKNDLSKMFQHYKIAMIIKVEKKFRN